MFVRAAEMRSQKSQPSTTARAAKRVCGKHARHRALKASGFAPTAIEAPLTREGGRMVLGVQAGLAGREDNPTAAKQVQMERTAWVWKGVMGRKDGFG